MTTEVSWITAFLDFAPGSFDDGVRFWAAATGHDAGSSRGDLDEFATLVPPDGDAHLKVQRLGEGDDRIHLDLHVPDLRAAADAAGALGATELPSLDPGYVAMRSPAGLAFCFVPPRDAATPPTPVVWPGGHTSAPDQVCIDVPASAYDAEVRFWSAVTGWPTRSSAVSADFTSLRRPPEVARRVLLQRLGADDPGRTARAHLDFATSDRSAETDRHVALGAAVVAVHPVWTVLRDPLGRAYCLTDRDPATGLLP